MYKIIGGDGKEYGPVSAEALQQWHAEGRVNGDTQVQMDGGTWQPMSAFPEFAALAAPKPVAAAPPATPPPFPTAPQTGGPTPVPEGDYELDLGGCASRGWQIVQNNFFLLFGGVFIYCVIMLFLRVLGALPLAGRVFSIGSYVIGGPLLGGICYLYLRVIRRDPAAGVGDVFAGFQRIFLQLFLGQMVPGILAALCLVPVIVVFKLMIMPGLADSAFFQALSSGQKADPNQIVQQWTQFQQQLQQISATHWEVFGGVLLLCAIPMTFLKVSWLFTLPLVIDKRMNFWEAMWTSWRRVNQHWWMAFGLYVVIVLIVLAGAMACCVGLIVAIPVGVATQMYAYETLFSGRNN